MFVNFDSVFNETEETKTKVPYALLEYLSNELPDGLKYQAAEDGICYAVSDTDSFTISGFSVELSDDQKKILGPDFTTDDMFKYFYNAQRTIPLKLNKPNTLILNGHEIPIEKMAFNPYNPVKIVESSFFAQPPEFPKPFHITIGGSGYETTILVSRTPNESVNVCSFESIDSTPLKINYMFDEVEHNFTLNISVQLKNATTVQEMLEAMQIYNAFMRGKGVICGFELESKLTSKKRKAFPNSTIKFWEKVLKLEKCLDVSFQLPYEDVPFGKVCLVEHLYQNLIKNKPIRDNQQIKTLDGGWNIDDEEKLKSAIGSLLMFQFEATYSFELFGVEKVLPCFICVFDAKLNDYTKMDKKYTLSLGDKSDDEPMYTSTRCFANEDQLAAFKKKDHNKIAKSFQIAKKASDYL